MHVLVLFNNIFYKFIFFLFLNHRFNFFKSYFLFFKRSNIKEIIETIMAYMNYISHTYIYIYIYIKADNIYYHILSHI